MQGGELEGMAPEEMGDDRENGYQSDQTYGEPEFEPPEPQIEAELHPGTIVEMQEEENRMSGQSSIIEHHHSTQGPTSNTINEDDESMVMMEESEYNHRAASSTTKNTFIRMTGHKSINQPKNGPLPTLSKQGSNPSIISEENIKFKVLNPKTNPGSNYSKQNQQRMTERSGAESKHQNNYTVTPNDS